MSVMLLPAPRWPLQTRQKFLYGEHLQFVRHLAEVHVNELIKKQLRSSKH